MRVVLENPCRYRLDILGRKRGKQVILGRKRGNLMDTPTVVHQRCGQHASFCKTCLSYHLYLL